MNSAVAVAEIAEENGNRIQTCIDSVFGKHTPIPD